MRSEPGGSESGARALDASAVLAYLQREPGYEVVQKVMAKGAWMSTVNLAEVLSKVAARGIDAELVRVRLSALGLQTVHFNDDDALLSAHLYLGTKAPGLSLGDRACLVLASRRRGAAFTADTAWNRLDLGVEVVLIR